MLSAAEEGKKNPWTPAPVCLRGKKNPSCPQIQGTSGVLVLQELQAGI